MDIADTSVHHCDVSIQLKSITKSWLKIKCVSTESSTWVSALHTPKEESLYEHSMAYSTLGG